MQTFAVINENGLKFNLVAVGHGDKYGRNDCLTNDKDKASDTLIEFYDARYPHTTHGQFVSRYYAGTLLGLDGYHGHKLGLDGGLCLEGGVPSWTIDQLAAQMAARWIESIMSVQS